MRKKLKDIAEIKFCLASSSKDLNITHAKFITPSNLSENNNIENIIIDNKYKFDIIMASKYHKLRKIT